MVSQSKPPWCHQQELASGQHSLILEVLQSSSSLPATELVPHHWVRDPLSFSVPSAVVCCRSSGSAGCVCGPLACMFCFSAIVLLYFQKTRSYYFVGCMWRSEATSGAGSFLPPRGPRVGTELRCQAASVLPTVSLALLKIFLIVLRKSLSLSLKLRHDFRDCSNSIPLPQPL